MPKSKEKPKSKEIKLPALDFGQKQSVFAMAKPAKTFTQAPKIGAGFRITQHKGGGK